MTALKERAARLLALIDGDYLDMDPHTIIEDAEALIRDQAARIAELEASVEHYKAGANKIARVELAQREEIRRLTAAVDAGPTPLRGRVTRRT